MDNEKDLKKITRRYFIRGSALAIVGIAAGSLLSGCASGGEKSPDGAQQATGRKIAVIAQDRDEIEWIDLGEEGEAREIQLPGVNVVLQVEKGKIRYLRSDCPDQICVKTGWLTEVGHMAACLPNRSLMVIEDKS